MFTLQLYPRVHYGEGAASKAGPEIARLEARKALIVTDPGVLAASVAQPVLSSLDEAGIRYEIFSGVETNPADVHVMAAPKRTARPGPTASSGSAAAAPWTSPSRRRRWSATAATSASTKRACAPA